MLFRHPGYQTRYVSLWVCFRTKAIKQICARKQATQLDYTVYIGGFAMREKTAQSSIWEAVVEIMFLFVFLSLRFQRVHLSVDEFYPLPPGITRVWSGEESSWQNWWCVVCSACDSSLSLWMLLRGGEKLIRFGAD